MKPLPPVRVHHPHVEFVAGSPVVSGTRVPVRRLWAWHSKGVLVATLVKRYPSLGWAKVLDALSFCHDNREIIETDLDNESETLNEPPGVWEYEQMKLPFGRG